MPNTAGLVVNLPDVIFGLLLIVGLFIGLFVGLFRQVIVLAAAYVAAILASRFYTAVGPTIPLSISPNGTVRAALALGGLFVILTVLLVWATHYVHNPIGMTDQLTFLSGRAVAAVVGVVASSLFVAVFVTAFVMSLNGSWGAEQERSQLQWKLAIRQSTVVQMLGSYVWPVSRDARDYLPLGPFLPN